MKYITQRMRRFCAFATGFVFLASGILKLVDPTGAGLVMSEYFKFFHTGFLDFMAKPAGVAFALAESIIGAALITGVWRKVTAIAAAAFMAFFTALTLILVIFNPEMDCGCFGEAIHLTHMQTFLKNIVLCLLLAGAFLPFKELGKPKKRKYVSFGIAAASISAFALWHIMYIPVADFTDYKCGTVLYGAESNEKDAYADGQAIFIYEKDGTRESFTLENLPDSTWTFINMENTAGDSYGTAAPVLSFYDAKGNDLDHKALDGKVMAVTVYRTDISEKKWQDIIGFLTSAREKGFTPLLIVASDPQLIMKELESLSPDTMEAIMECILYSSYKTLITVNRSNGGATYLHNGMIIEKWARLQLPDAEELEELYRMEATELMADRSAKNSMIFQGFLLYLCAILLLV